MQFMRHAEIERSPARAWAWASLLALASVDVRGCGLAAGGAFRSCDCRDERRLIAVNSRSSAHAAEHRHARGVAADLASCLPGWAWPGDCTACAAVAL